MLAGAQHDIRQVYQFLWLSSVCDLCDDIDEEEESSCIEVDYPSMLKNPEFIVKVPSNEPHKLTQNELSNLKIWVFPK